MFNLLATDPRKELEPPSTDPGTASDTDRTKQQPTAPDPPYKPYARKPGPPDPPYEPYKGT
jgi:hypothetical protein